MTKLNLYFDYCRLLLLALRSLFSPALSDPKIDKVFHTKAFNYRVHYPFFQSFFFSFNEIFCIRDYPPFSNLKNYIDLGSNIGLSILWYHFFNPNLTIYAFEPDPFMLRFLKKNIKEANIKNCFLFNKAVSDKVGRRKYYRIIDQVQNLDSGLNLNLPLPFETLLTSTQKLSPLIKKIGKVSLIKMDIEGEEYRVFEEIFLTKTINNVEKIFFESHFFKKSEHGSYCSLLSSLKKFGKIETRINSGYTSLNYWENKNSFPNKS